MMFYRAILFIMILSIFTVGCSSSKPASKSDILSPADDLFKMISKEGLKGKVTIVDFWATWCAPCRKQIPSLVDLYSDYHSKGLRVIGISLDRPSPLTPDPQKAVEMMAKKFEINYPVGIANEKILSQYPPISGIPTAYIYDRKGKLVETLVGLHPSSKLETIIKELL